MKNWKSIKEEIYYEDGSLRDIYVFDTNKEDWKAWGSLINEKYKVEFFNGRTQQVEDRINVEELLKYFSAPEDFKDVNKARIKLGKVTIICQLHYESEMESDIDPKEVKSEEDHHAILEYLKTVASTLKKKVVVTSEMEPEDILLEV
ncbi:hypothetical protein [Pontibacter lucknowensis]|uniref:Uncharacterized protein n=1 Tax=Pontibacter lucknowensis TaxID=1077936 RepID=A0A1N7BHU9_9BACT|nr:hypothetical protein [Pontibacter lucknowensis]SIR50971.1 hypothetical protein SAMN05421545_3973 [Pontibacter lucknowensis]